MKTIPSDSTLVNSLSLCDFTNHICRPCEVEVLHVSSLRLQRGVPGWCSLTWLALSKDTLTHRSHTDNATSSTAWIIHFTPEAHFLWTSAWAAGISLFRHAVVVQLAVRAWLRHPEMPSADERGGQRKHTVSPNRSASQKNQTSPHFY